MSTRQKIKILVLGIICLFMASCIGVQRSSKQNTLRQNYLNTHPTISTAWRRAILSGNILIGMTEEAVMASLGHPDKINLSDERHRSAWIYTSSRRSFNARVKYGYVYFKNHRVTSWQSSEPAR